MSRKFRALLIITALLSSSCTNSQNYLLEERFQTSEYLPEYDMPLDCAGDAGDVCKNGAVYYYKPF